MGVKYKRMFNLGIVSDMKNMEQHYSEMAERGWLIDKIGLVFDRYRAVEPCKKRFFVDLLPQITLLDHSDNEEAQDYRRICEESGWTFAAAQKFQQVFYTDIENPEPIPIHTDNSVLANICLKASIKYEWFLFLFAPMAFWPFFVGIDDLLLNNFFLLYLLGTFFFAIGLGWVYGYLIYWYIRTKKAAKHSLPMPPVNRRLSKLRMQLLIAGLVGYIMCMVTGIISTTFAGVPMIAIFLSLFMGVSAIYLFFWAWQQIEKKQRTRASNIRFVVITIAVFAVFSFILNRGIDYAIESAPSASYHQELFDNRLVITLADMGVMAEPENAYGEVLGSFAVPVNYYYRETNADEGVGVLTQVYRAVNKTFAGWEFERFKDVLREPANRPARLMDGTFAVLSSSDAASWGAEKGLMLHSVGDNGVLVILLSDKTILELYMGYEEGKTVDLETLSRAAQKLW